MENDYLMVDFVQLEFYIEEKKVDGHADTHRRTFWLFNIDIFL